MYSGIPVTYLFYLQKVNTVQTFDNDFYKQSVRSLVFQRPHRKQEKEVPQNHGSYCVD